MAKSEAMKAFDRMSRDERRAARNVRNEAAASLGMRRIAFNRAVLNEDQDALDELRLAAAESEWEFDPERFQQFLDMIIAFIKAIMMIFGGF